MNKRLIVSVILSCASMMGSFLDAKKIRKITREMLLIKKAKAPDFEETTSLKKQAEDAEAEKKIYNSVQFGDYLRPWENGSPDELVAFDFEDAALSALVKYIEERYRIVCILDDAINPLPQGGKSIAGIKISFKTNAPLPKKDAWSLFVTFLEMNGLSIVPGPGPAPKTYRIKVSDPRQPNNANRSPLPFFVGINPRFLPDSDVRIRYLYFARNASLDVIKNVIETIKSISSPNIVVFPDLRAILITDLSANIKSMLEIIEVLEDSTRPESMTIIKLEHADATKIAKFYKDLTKEGGMGQQEVMRRLGRLPQTLSYFPPGVRVIPEPRTNTIILLGSAEANKRVAEFVVKELDKQSTLPYRLTNIYKLRHVKASAIAQILDAVLKFKAGSEEAKSGGVRGGDKYFKQVSVVPEDSGNFLIIIADHEEYLKIYDVLQQIDVEQPQVALKVLIVNMDITDEKQLGVQLRAKYPGLAGLLGTNTSFQSATLGAVQENSSGSGTTRLLGDLINLATGGSIGSTFLALGSDFYGVWGMLKILQTFTNTTITSNPFIIAVNNYKAEITIGETRQVVSGTIYSASANDQQTYREQSANLVVAITPRISYEGYVTLDIHIKDDQFLDPTVLTSPDRIERDIKTALTVANNQTVVLGGFVRESYREKEYDSFPLLSKIPVLGWLFKSKDAQKQKTSLLVFISPEIIPVKENSAVNEFTSLQLADAAETLSMSSGSQKNLDPIERFYFGSFDKGEELLRSFVEREERYLYPYQKRKREGLLASGKRLSDFL